MTLCIFEVAAGAFAVYVYCLNVNVVCFRVIKVVKEQLDYQVSGYEIVF